MIATLELRHETAEWTPPVVTTVASEDRGIEELTEAISAHQTFLGQDGRLQERRNRGLRARIRDLAEEKLAGVLWRNSYIETRFDGIFAEVTSGQLSPYRAASRLVEEFAGDSGSPADRNSKS